MSDDINERLEQWGATETPPPDAAFSDRLEQDLRSAIYFRAPAMGRGDRGGRRWFPRPALVVGCVVLLIGGVAWWTQRPDASTRTVAVDTATDTELTFADGSRQPADAGEVLPEGTRVDVGPEGSAVIAGVVLDPGDRALIVDGIIELLARATATPVPSPDPPAPTVSDVPTPTPVPPPSGPTPTTDTPTPRATPTPTVGVTPTPAPPAPSDRPAFVIDLGATAAGDALVLAWTVTGAPPELLGWEVVALTGDLRRTVAVIRDPDVRDLTVTGPRADGYRVLARGEDTILAESDIVAP